MFRSHMFFENVRQVPARGTDLCEFTVPAETEICNLQVEVVQNRGYLDDIGVHVMDRVNYNLWPLWFQAKKSAVQGKVLPSFKLLASGKLSWGTLSFCPPAPGPYFVVLDNTESVVTAKVVRVQARALAAEMNMRKHVREELVGRLGWKETWGYFVNAERDLEQRQFSGSCYHMRTALATLWKQVAEELAGEQIPFDLGKSSNIGALRKVTNEYSAEHFGSALAQIWSLTSELAHPEKRDGQEPRPEETVFAGRCVYASAAFLLSLLRAK